MKGGGENEMKKCPYCNSDKVQKVDPDSDSNQMSMILFWCEGCNTWFFDSEDSGVPDK